MAKFLLPERVGLYGLISATLGWVLYFVGCEFYAFSTRELIGRPANDLLGLLRDQLVFIVVAHALVWPIVLLGFGAGWLPWAYCAWFLALLALEHVGLEFGRVLVAVGKPLVASLVLFLRGGAWCVVIVLVMWQLPETRNLDALFGAWTVGSLLGCTIGIASIMRYDKASLFRAVDWRWIAKGLRVALPLMMASLAIRGIFTLDRYMVDGTGGSEVLGAYVLFASLGMAVLSFLDAGVIDFAYPRIVASVKQKNRTEFIGRMRQLTVSVSVTVISLSIASWLVSTVLLIWLDNPVYADNAFLLPWILVAVAIYGVSTVPHIALYAHGEDRTIFVSQAAGFAAFVAVSILGSGTFGVIIVPCALIAAFTIVLIWKSVSYALLSRSGDLWTHEVPLRREEPLA